MDTPLDTAPAPHSNFAPGIPPAPLFRSLTKRRAFSLVEVVLAVGVVAFAFVAIMGLIPAGMQQFRQAIDTSVGAQIGQRVVEDAEQTDFNTLVDYANTQNLVQPGRLFYFRSPTYTQSQQANGNPAAPGACIRYFDEDGNEVVPAARAGSPPNLSGNPTNTELNTVVYYVNTRITAATPLPQSPNSTLTGVPTLATVTVQVAFNPGHQAIPVNNTTCLFDTTQMPGVKVRNYSAQVGRNY